MDELKQISASEVRLHTSKDSCWLVIHGKVYDVTKFLEDHPGGDEVLIHASGVGDASQTFEDVGHSATARKRMTNYLIGALEGYDHSKSPAGGARNEASIKGSSGVDGSVKKTNVVHPPMHSPFGLTDYLLPLFLLLVAVASWLFA